MVWHYRINAPLVQIEFDLVAGKAEEGVETEVTHVSTI